MTGAGFGGCTVSLVEKEHVPGFISGLKSVYQEITGLVPDFYQPEISDGAGRISW
jgi:galactokinase